MPRATPLLALLGLAGCLFGRGVDDAERPTCIAYIDCASAVAPAALAGIIEAFGEDGTCWGEQGVEACEASCAIGREQLDVGDDAPASCGAPPEEPPDDCATLSDPTAYCDIDIGTTDLIRSIDCEDTEPVSCIADALRRCSEEIQQELLECLTR